MYQKKNYYILIAVLSILVLLPSIASTEKKPIFSPYLQTYPKGKIDWDKGLIHGIGQVPLKADSNKIKVLSTARLIASSNIVELAAGIRLDAKRRLGALENKKYSIKLKAFLRHIREERKIIRKNNKKYYQVVRVAPIKGVKGLTAQLIDHLEGKEIDLPLPEQDFRPSTELKDRDMPWLVLDARGIFATDPVKPAILPQITTADGEVIYQAEQVNKQALLNRGMARYVTSNVTPQQLEANWKDDLQVLAELLRFLRPDEAFAADKKRRKRKRFIVQDVKKAAGLLNTNLVISAQDAQELKAKDASSKILKNCRVIVIPTGSLGGIEGMIQSILAQNNH